MNPNDYLGSRYFSIGAPMKDSYYAAVSEVAMLDDAPPRAVVFAEFEKALCDIIGVSCDEQAAAEYYKHMKY